MSATEITLQIADHEQSVFYLPGDGSVTRFEDDQASGGAVTWTPVQRKVAVVRLRAIADQIEAETP